MIALLLLLSGVAEAQTLPNGRPSATPFTAASSTPDATPHAAESRFDGDVLQTDSGPLRTRMDLTRCTQVGTPKVLKKIPGDQPACDLCRYEASCPVEETIRIPGSSAPASSTTYNVSYTPLCSPVNAQRTDCPDFRSCARLSRAFNYSNNAGRWRDIYIRQQGTRPVTAYDYMQNPGKYEVPDTTVHPMPNGAQTTFTAVSRYRQVPDTYNYPPGAACATHNYCVSAVEMTVTRPGRPPVTGNGLVACFGSAMNECPSATDCAGQRTYDIQDAQRVVNQNPSGNGADGSTGGSPSGKGL